MRNQWTSLHTRSEWTSGTGPLVALGLARVAAILQFPVTDAAARRHRLQAGLPPSNIRVFGVDLFEAGLAAGTRDDPLGGHLAGSAVALVADGVAAVVVAVQATAARRPATVEEGHVGGDADRGPILLPTVTF